MSSVAVEEGLKIISFITAMTRWIIISQSQIPGQSSQGEHLLPVR
jgi:hypothetical protein